MNRVMVKKRKILALFAISSSTSMIFLDSTVLPVALPTIQRELSLAPIDLQWILNSYLLAIASLALGGGRIADLFGHRRLFCIGLLIFAIASAIGGLANSAAWLIISRSFQGVGGAIMGPSALSLIIETFDPKERGRALGIMVGFSSLFLSLGPFLGGLFTQFLSWRAVFWINLPIAFSGVICALIAIPKSKKLEESFDFYGFITLLIGLSSLIYALMEGRTEGFASVKILTFFGLFVLSCLFLPFSEKLAKDPFFDLTLFKRAPFVGGCLVVLITQFLLMMTVYWAIFFQNALGLSPLNAGLLTLISTLPIIGFAPFAGHLFDKVGPRWPIGIGYSLVIFGFMWFYFFLRIESWPYLIPALLMFGAGIPLILTPNSTTTLTSVPQTKRGAASGVYNTMRYIGASLGIAVFGMLIETSRKGRFNKLLNSSRMTKGLTAKEFTGLSSQTEPAIERFNALSPQLKPIVSEMYSESSYFAYSITAIAAILISSFALFIAIRLFRNYNKN